MLQITPLNAIWLITLGLCGLFVSLFNIDWHRHPQVKANGLLINLLMAAAVCAVVASNLGTMVVMAEIMALCAVFLINGSKRANCGLRWAVSVRCCWQSPAGWCGSATARWIWGCLINALSNCRWAPISGCSALSALVCWPGLSRYTVGCRRLRQRQRSRRRAVLDRGDENRAAGHSHAISAWRQCAAVVGRGAVGAWDDHRLCRRSVR